MMHGHDVVSSYKTLHQAVWTGAMPTVEFLYRCDAPDMERHMHMSLSPVRDGDDIVAILYQSIPIEQVARVPIPLFGREVLAARLPFVPNRRVVVRMSLAGYDRQQIAVRLGWSDAKVRNLLSRGMDDLRAQLAERLTEETTDG